MPARCTLQFVRRCYGLRDIYGRFDLRFDSNAKKNDSQVPNQTWPLDSWRWKFSNCLFWPYLVSSPLTYDLLPSKFNQFIFVPTCIKVVTLLKFPQEVCKISCSQLVIYKYGQMDRLTKERMPLAAKWRHWHRLQWRLWYRNAAVSHMPQSKQIKMTLTLQEKTSTDRQNHKTWCQLAVSKHWRQ